MWILEVTHRQCFYRNMHVHDATARLNTTVIPEEIQGFIEQLEIREKGLDNLYHDLLEVNLEDLEKATGEEQHY